MTSAAELELRLAGEAAGRRVRTGGRDLKKSCIHIAQPDGRLIPFEAYNLFYRDGCGDSLAAIRATLDGQHRRRAVPAATVTLHPWPARAAVLSPKEP